MKTLPEKLRVVPSETPYLSPASEASKRRCKHKQTPVLGKIMRKTLRIVDIQLYGYLCVHIYIPRLPETILKKIGFHQRLFLR